MAEKWYPSKWGKEDILGSLNMVTPASMLRALALIKTGKLYDLSHVLQPDMPVSKFHGSYFANTQYTLENGAEWHDKHRGVTRNGYSAQNLRISMSDHTGTHIDQLNHVGERQQDGEYLLYNGLRNAEVIDTFGTKRLGIEHMPPFIARGVFADVVTHLDKDILPAGYAISPEEIDSTLSAEGVEVHSGDIVLVHTGWGKLWNDPDRSIAGEPGLSKRCAQWANAHDLLAWGTDQFGTDAIPPETEGEVLPLHIEMLTRSGIRLIENVFMQELSRDRVYTLTLFVAPLKIKGGTGSPIRLFGMI